MLENEYEVDALCLLHRYKSIRAITSVIADARGGQGLNPLFKMATSNIVTSLFVSFFSLWNVIKTKIVFNFFDSHFELQF